MAKIENFEDIESWKIARELTRQIYKISSTGDFSCDFPLRDQIRRSTISIMSNTAEGFERGGDKEFLQFLSIAKGSCGEARSQLFIALRNPNLKQFIESLMKRADYWAAL
jgi:four helix bundle protein